MWRLARGVGQGLRAEVGSRRAIRAALKQVSKAVSERPSKGELRFCWDLDNTLVNSGVLIRTGKSLHEAVVHAEPVPNMLDFYRAIRDGIPEATHFILSARAGAMRADTLGWLERHRIPTNDTVAFVPTADAKTRIWQLLARDANLVIVDDLSFDHEREEPSRYEDLIEVAQCVAFIYVGSDEIAAIAADSRAIEGAVSRIINTAKTSAPTDPDVRFREHRDRC